MPDLPGVHLRQRRPARHEEHRRRTLTLITQLEDRGQTRLADHLEARIAEIRDNVAPAGAAEDTRSDAG